MLLQRAIIFRSKRLKKNHAYKSKYPLTEYFFDFKIDDEPFLINAVHLKAENSKGLIFFLHGTLNHIQYHLPKTDFFIEQQYDVLLLDYPSYGKSKGKLTEYFLHKIVETTFHKAIDILKYSGKIILYGRSLGTAIASNLASKIDVDALILVSPYYDMPDLFHQKIRLFPFKKLKFKLENHQYLPHVKCDKYIFHGNMDKLIPIHLSQKLIPFLTSETHFIEIEDANHFNIHEHTLYIEKMKFILK